MTPASRCSLLIVTLLLSGCAEDRSPAQTAASAQPAHLSARPAEGLGVLLRLGDGVEVLSRRVLERAPRPPRRAFRSWRGRWEVQDASGRVLHAGRFRLPRRRHALYGDRAGPAAAADVALERPVVWLRVPRPVGSHRLVLYRDHGRVRLGEVGL